LGDGAEILIFQLLALGRRCAEERPTRVDQVGPGVIEILVDEEVFLLWTNSREDLLGVVVAEKAEDAERVNRQSVHRLEQRRFLVESLTRPADESGWYDQRGTVRAFIDERGTGRVPGRVAACLKGGADAAGGERRGVRLALNEFLAAELHDGSAVARRS